MAEQEITYIPYGLNEISQQDLMTDLANGVPNYLNSKRWAKKDKYRLAWINAYQDIMDHGIAGASNDSGIWQVNYNGDVIDLDNRSNIEKEMYKDAAFYILLRMSRMTPRLKEAEEEKKEKLPTFNFIEDFNKSLLNKYYGGSSDRFVDPDYGWNSLDARGKDGLRPTAERKKQMVKALEEYSKGLLDGKYSFEGTSFTDLLDAKTKILTAIDALKNTPNDESDDIPAFNALGLNYRAYFSNGGNDASTHLGTDGNPLTWNQWNELLRLTAEEKAKADAEKAKQALAKEKANRYGHFRFYGANLAGKPLTPEHSTLNYLKELAAKDNLNGDEQSELVGAFKLAERNGALQNLTTEELKRFGPGYANNPRRLKKIKDLEGLYWDTIGHRIIKPYAQGIAPQTSFQDILDLNNPEKIKEKLQATPISKEGWTSADTADVVSMIGDLVSLGGLWANIGGTATSLTSDLYADISRGKDVGSILNGVFANLGWGLAGMLPGAKSTRLVARAARLVHKAIVLAQSAGIVLDSEIQQSALKFTKPSEYKNITSKDLENLKYLFHAVTGTTNVAKSHYRAKQYRETLNKLEVQTKNGTKSLSNKLVKDINKAGRRSGQKAAESKFKEYTGLEAAEGQFKFSENGVSRFNPVRYSSKLAKVTSNDQQLKGKQVTDNEALLEILRKDSERPWYNWNKGYPKFELSSFRKNTSNNLSNNSEQNTSTSTANTTESLPEALTPRQTVTTEEVISNKEVRKAYRGLFKNEFSKNPIQSGDYTINGTNIKVVKQPDGSFNLLVKGEVIDNFNNQVHLLLAVKDLVINNRKVSNGTTVKKIDVKEMGKLLRDLKRKGWLKQGGQIESLDKVIEDFVNNNNI